MKDMLFWINLDAGSLCNTVGKTLAKVIRYATYTLKLKSEIRKRLFLMLNETPALQKFYILC